MAIRAAVGAFVVMSMLASAAACSSDSEKAAAPPTIAQDASVQETEAPDTGAKSTCDPYEARKSGVDVVIGPTGLEAALTQAIAGAKTSLDIMAYEISYKPIFNAINEAKTRGVALRIVADRANSKPLKDAFADSVHDSPASLPHSGAKLIMIDGTHAFIGSADLTEAAMTKERNYGTWIQDADDLATMKAVFEQDFKGEGAAPACKRMIISPGSGHDVIVEHVASAEEKVDLEVKTVTDPKVIAALKAKAGEGVAVRVLLSGPEVTPGTDAVGTDLKAGGVDVRYFRNPDVHSRLIVTERGALIGSHELTAESLDQNREISAIVADEAEVAKVNTQFESDWGKAALR